jgi:hypothetical protein
VSYGKSHLEAQKKKAAHPEPLFTKPRELMPSTKPTGTGVRHLIDGSENTGRTLGVNKGIPYS